MTFLKAFGNFWYDFIIGDDWKIAVYTVIALVVVALLALAGTLSDCVVVAIGTALLCAFFVLGVVHDARKMAR